MATFTVTTAADRVDAGDGRLSLREAVRAAGARDGLDVIRFSDAVEGGRLVLTRGELVLNDDVRIDGSRDNTDQTTLDAGQESRVVRIDDPGTQARLEDLLVTGGYAPEGVSGESPDGGGILLADRTGLDLVRSTVAENTAGGYYGGTGGGISAGLDTTIAVIGSEIINNQGRDGGGLFAESGSRISIESSLLGGNTASGGRSGNGGALQVRDGATEIDSSAIQGNVASYNAGAIDAPGGTLRITNSTIADNEARNASGRGSPADAGAIDASEVTIQSSTVTGNAVGAGYGGYTATGGVAADELRLADSIVVGNFFGRAGDAQITESDVDADRLASNAHNVFGSDVAGEAEGDVENALLESVFARVDPSTGGGRLALNGGATPTAALADEPFNPALSGANPESSPAIDQRGFVRPAPDGTNPDIGAFEARQGSTSAEPSPFNDAIAGTAAGDAVRADAGNDLVRGFAGDDQLFGEAGSDTLYAGGGNDQVRGGPGAELLSGGPGVDRLTGGSGRDDFDVDQGHTGVGAGGRDRLLDFRQGEDVIDLAGVDARGGAAGDQAFSFIGTNAFSGPGQLRYQASGADTLIQGSTDGDNALELELQVTGRVALAGNDFVL